MSLKAKLIAGVLSTMILIIGVCSFFTLYSVNIFSDNAEKLTSGLSADVSRDVSGFSEHYAGTLTFHETENVKDAITNIINRAKSDLITISTFEEIYSADEQALHTLFQKFSEQNDIIQYIYLGTENKTFSIYPEVEGLPSDYDPTSRPWYGPAKTLQKGEIFVTDAYLDGTGKEYMVTVSAPIFLNNKFYGVLGLDISLEKLTTQIANSKVGNTGYVILTDKEGALLAYKDKKLVTDHANISSLPIFKEKKGDTIYLDIDQVTYISGKDEVTGWQIFSVISQEEVKSFSSTISQNMSKRISEAESSLESILTKTFTTQFVVILLLLAISIVISILFARYFINPIKKLSTFLQSVASGDLRKKMETKSKDEIGLLFSSVNHMVDSLKDMAQKMAHLIQEVEKDSNILNEQAHVSSNVTETVVTAMTEVSRGSEQLAADMVNISSNVEANNQAVSSMANNIVKIVEHAKNTKTATSDGKIAMENMNKKIHTIVSQSEESTLIMKELDRKLQAITDITTLIHDIAEQTNLLSLNASIEAARAGEQGRGFAVVAQEVKKLAEQSSHSVSEIAILISEIQNDSEKALINIDQGRKSAVEGANMTKNTEASFNNIISFIDDLTKDIDAIANASERLSSSSQSISSSVDSVVSISEQTSAGVQEVTSTTEEQRQAVNEVQAISENLKAQTIELRKSINHFKI
ncbi:methyl-accepting chemotaxis protein [Cytobacillus sp. FJAT-54145]|uniref:Methyl-accepting chemotaxis protein n=1 Tax=Cytobacillus spartinae TaxID=3299023 RepID=A0ABW6K579_9BACI